MEINLEQLKKNFLTIKDIRGKVIDVFNILETHLVKLKKTYSEFVENNRQNLFVFGLDSFQFQSKLIDIEYDDMKRLFLAINNRMYCEYYKLYKIISEYVKENIPVKKTLELIKLTNNFPVYKDLEPYKQYKFELIQGLHENIVLLLYEINEFIINKENELGIHKKKQDIGLNINNFVTTFNYNILMIKEKGMLFISYIEFFHNLHTKYLQRFAMKMNLMYNQVTHDIRFEDGPNTSETKKKELIHSFESDNIDRSLIKEIRRSFNDSESNSSESPEKFDNTKYELSIEKNTNNLYINAVEQNAPITELENSKCLIINQRSASNDEKSESPRIFNTNNEKYKNMFKNNVKKMISGMNIFKKKQNEDTISNVSSESALNENNIKSPESSMIIKTNSEDENEKQDNNNNNVNNDSIIHKSRSAEEIFKEISKQCNELTVSFLYPQQYNDIDVLGIDNSIDKNIVESVLDTINVLEDPIVEMPELLIVEDQMKNDVDIENKDDTMSVITMDYIAENKEAIQEEKMEEIMDVLEYKEDKENKIIEDASEKENIIENEDAIEKEEVTIKILDVIEENNDENPKKKKRTYKPRKKS
jgi:hypothetical protein